MRQEQDRSPTIGPKPSCTNASPLIAGPLLQVAQENEWSWTLDDKETAMITSVSNSDARRPRRHASHDAAQANMSP